MDEYKRRRRRSRAVMSMFLDSLGGSIDNVDVANFDSDGTDLKALIVGIDPIQDLHGYDNPWPAGGGVNKFDKDSFDSTSDYTTDYNNYFYSAPIILKPNTNYVMSPTSTEQLSVSKYFVLFRNPDASDPDALSPVGIDFRYPVTAGVPTTVTFTTGATGAIRFAIPATGGQPDATALTAFMSINWQLEEGSTASAWTPYSNICPITGHSSVNVIVSPTLNPLDGTITNIPLGGTYYGGQLDVLTGVLTVTHANISSYNGEAINEPWISSMDAYSPGAMPTTGAQVVYPLATPTTTQLTGQQIATFVGTNHVWCDSGKIIHLEY